MWLLVVICDSYSKSDERNTGIKRTHVNRFVKGQVTRATFSFNLSRNNVALQVERKCYPYNLALIQLFWEKQTEKYLQFYTYYWYLYSILTWKNTKKRQDQHDFLQKETVASRRLTKNSKCRLPRSIRVLLLIYTCGNIFSTKHAGLQLFSSYSAIREDSSVRKRSTDYFKTRESGQVSFPTEVYTFVFERSNLQEILSLRKKFLKATNSHSHCGLKKIVLECKRAL